MPGNKKPRKKFANTVCKLKTNSPVNIRYNKTGDLRLKLPPQISLQQFLTGKSNLAAWDTIYFRVQVGIYLSSHFETDSLGVNLQATVDLLVRIKKHYEEKNIWLMDSLEHAAIKETLVVIDNMQDHTTRRQQLDAYNYVYKFVHVTKV